MVSAGAIVYELLGFAMVSRFVLIAVCWVMLFTIGMSQEELGELKLNFKLKGGIPEAVPINVPGAVLKSEDLIVNKDNRGIANIFVWVYTGRGAAPIVKPPPRNKKVSLAAKGFRFQPHSLVAQIGDTMTVTNADNVAYNVNLQFFNNPRNLLLTPQQKAAFKIAAGQPTVADVACNIHPWMSAKVLLLDHPFAAISDEDGEVLIRGLPVGNKLTFRAHHERGTFNNEIFVNGIKDKWRRNNFELTIKTGLNDVGVVELPVDEFK